MTLIGFGHTQTLEKYTYNGKTYFLIGCKADEDAKYKWAIQIGCIEYKANTSIEYTDISRLCYLTSANTKGEACGKIERTDAALSSDTKSLFIWTKAIKGKKEVVQYTKYDADKIFKIFEKNKGKAIACYNDDVKKACKWAYTQIDPKLPNGSCQGVEFSNADSMYVIGGNTGETPMIFKFQKGGTVKKATMEHKNFCSTTVTEGIQLKGDFIYFGVYDDGGKKPRYAIYSYPKSEI